MANRDWAYLARELVLLVAVLGLGQLFSAVRVLLERAGQQLTLDLRLRLNDKLQSQSAAYFAQRRTGDLLARVTADVESVQDVLIRGTDSVVANGLRVLGVAGIFIALQPKLGLLGADAAGWAAARPLQPARAAGLPRGAPAPGRYERAAGRQPGRRGDPGEQALRKSAAPALRSSGLAARSTTSRCRLCSCATGSSRWCAGLPTWAMC